MTRAVTVPPGRGGGHSGETWIGLTGRGPPGRNRQYGGQGGAGSSGGHGRWSSWPWPPPSARPLQTEHFYPPQKKSMGQLMGYQEPSGAVTQEQDSPQEQEALLGLSSEAEVHSGHDVTLGALTGCLSNHFHFRSSCCGCGGHS